MAAPKKPVSRKKPAKKAARPAPKAAAKPAAAPQPAPQPVFTVVNGDRNARPQPEWWVNAVKYAQANPAVTFVAIIAAALGLILLLD